MKSIRAAAAILCAADTKRVTLIRIRSSYV